MYMHGYSHIWKLFFWRKVQRPGKIRFFPQSLLNVIFPLWFFELLCIYIQVATYCIHTSFVCVLYPFMHSFVITQGMARALVIIMQITVMKTRESKHCYRGRAMHLSLVFFLVIMTTKKNIWRIANTVKKIVPTSL